MLQALKELVWPSGPSVPAELPDWHWTHDQWKLEQYHTQLLFVPDNMKVGGKYHNVLKELVPGEEPRNPSCYTHAKFLAFKQDLGEFSNAVIIAGDFKPSGFITNGSAPDPAVVQGELYSVEASKLYLLDKHKRNGVQFVRQRVKITYPWRYVSWGKENKMPKISPHCFITIVAWMYVGVPTYWDSRIGGVFAKPLPLFEHEPPRPWIGEFYRFDV